MENSSSQEQIDKYNELANTTDDPKLKDIFTSILQSKQKDSKEE